jgi:hypothetical protein
MNRQSHFQHIMKTFILGVTLGVLVCTATAQDTAYKALRLLASAHGQSVLNKVVEVAGSRGTPQPAKWKITLDDPMSRSGVREFEISGGRIISERAPTRLYAGAARLMNFSKLNLDSDGAFTVANKQAVRAQIGFDTVDYVLRMDEDTDTPTWALRLITGGGRQTGTIFIAAESGHIVRTSGMSEATGGDREYVRERPQPRSGEPDNVSSETDEDHGGGVFDHLKRFHERMKRRMARDHDTVEEFFTGRSAGDRDYRDNRPSDSYQDTVEPPRNY